MSSGLDITHLQSLKRLAIRLLLIVGLAAMLALILIVSEEPSSVYAAPTSAESYRTDRRPDRERPVTTSQGSTSGFTQNASTSTARPRLVRR